MRVLRRVRALCSSLLLLVQLGAPGAAGAEVVELMPDEPSSWTLTNLFAPITGLFLGGPGYWYAAREIQVDTTPPGALLDLFYVRRNFQKRYEQARAPVTLRLPSRIEAGPRDSVRIRAMLDGHRQEEVSVRVRSREKSVLIELGPLSNTLVALTHTLLAGRETLSFVTTEALTFRLQARDEGFAVVLTETGTTPDARETLEGIESPLIAALSAQQLGEDLLVRVDLADRGREALEPRSRQDYDRVRDLYTFALDLVPADGGAEAVERARAALARLGAGALRGCALAFDATLREELDPAALARALTPSGAFVDPYLRAALRRLGELSPNGVIHLADGTRYRPDAPIELSAAASQAAEAVGYLALLRAFVAELEPPEYRRAALRGLVAPELPPVRFSSAVETAEAAERRCRASGT